MNELKKFIEKEQAKADRLKLRVESIKMPNRFISGLIKHGNC